MFAANSKRALLGASVLVGASLLAPGIASAKILWSGDYESGDFMQWHNTSGSAPNYSQMPNYCAPAPVGDGSCLSVDSNVVRQGRYSAKFTVKNSANGEEPRDCDGSKCERRRTELTGQITQPVVYDAMPYMAERWMSVSHYVPSNWTGGGSSGGATVFQVKSDDGKASPLLAIQLHDNHWTIWHRWHPDTDPTNPMPWQYQMFYDNVYPKADGSDSGADLRSDFPNQSVSQGALGSVKRGVWTDWIMQIKYDARGAGAGGTGFFRVWKREDKGDWVAVLDIKPKKISRGGMTFDHGIGYASPASGSSNGGYGIKAGLYMPKEEVWNDSVNRVIYNDNIKIGDENTRFQEMTPEGAAIPPSPPILNEVN